MRYVIILLIGCGAGYWYGFTDGRQNDRSVVERIVDRVGGLTRDHVGNDVDKQMEKIERR